MANSKIKRAGVITAFEEVKEWIHSVSSSECVYLLLFGYSFINHESKTIDVGGFFLHSYLNLFRIEF